MTIENEKRGTLHLCKGGLRESGIAMLVHVLTRAVLQVRRGSSSASPHPPFSLQASASSPSLRQTSGAPALSPQRMRTLPRVPLRSAIAPLVVRSHEPGLPAPADREGAAADWS